MRQTLEITKSILMGILFVMMVVTAFTVVTSKTNYFMGVKSYTVLTGSMNPLIPTGSVIYTFPTNDLNRGDIITFERKGIKITHRVADILNSKSEQISTLASPVASYKPTDIYYVTKGDANNVVDSFIVPRKDVYGKVFIHFPVLGKLIGDLKTPSGFLLGLILPAIFYILSELWVIKGEIEKSTERKVLERFGVSS